MIASNYRKFPEAMALQLVLLFGRCTWHTARPTQRSARAVRAARATLVKATPQIVRWVKKATPQWFKDAQRRAKALAAEVKNALESFTWDAGIAVPHFDDIWPHGKRKSAVEIWLEQWFPNKEHRTERIALTEFWLQQQGRWVHLGIDERIWSTARAGGYRA